MLKHPGAKVSQVIVVRLCENPKGLGKLQGLSGFL